MKGRKLSFQKLKIFIMDEIVTYSFANFISYISRLIIPYANGVITELVKRLQE